MTTRGVRSVAFNPMLFFEDLTVVRSREGVEERLEVKGMVDDRKVYLPIQLDLEEGDHVEQPLQSGKRRTFRVTHIVYRQSPFGSRDPRTIDHIEAHVEVVQSKQGAVQSTTSVGPVPGSGPAGLDGLHPDIRRVSVAKFRDGHFGSAVFEALRAVEARVQALTGYDDFGKTLMSKVFGETAALDPSRPGLSERNAKDEREGFKFLFMGALHGVRNPRGHGKDLPETEQEAFEYLCLASALMRRLDIAEERRRS